MANKDQTFEKLLDLQHMMGAYHHKRMAQHGPMADATRGKGRVLALLKMKDGIATKDMATVLGIRVSSLNETLARLETDGYVERKPSEEDGRIMLVYLTQKGREEQQPQMDLAEVLFAHFDDEALESLDGHLDRMVKAMEAELGDDWRANMEDMRRQRERMFHQAHGHGCGRGGHRHGHRCKHGHDRGWEHADDWGRGPGHGPRGCWAREYL